jgi:phage shock protein A
LSNKTTLLAAVVMEGEQASEKLSKQDGGTQQKIKRVEHARGKVKNRHPSARAHKIDSARWTRYR